ncbi:MAG: Rpn family recombination-promoting nuclease/putative transposase, partial [Burkholderiales bacterium]|nr:Rpn family recombination-promoting nuclease/putative transposase [Burkholderiales bacterium]
MKLTKKHDEFVKKCLTDIGMAREFLQTYLPPMVKDKCNFNNLRIDSGSYIEDDLKAHASDIVYQVDLINNGGYAYIYCLIEHQSNSDDLMSYRILRYQLAVIQRHMEKYPKDGLPLVVPIVFYNGTKTPYPYSTQLADLFVDKDLFEQIGLGNFKLADLTVIEDSEIAQHKKLAFVEILLKHIR